MASFDVYPEVEALLKPEIDTLLPLPPLLQYSLFITKPAITNLWLYRSLAGKIFISPYKSLVITKSLFITYTERVFYQIRYKKWLH